MVGEAGRGLAERGKSVGLGLVRCRGVGVYRESRLVPPDDTDDADDSEMIATI